MDNTRVLLSSRPNLGFNLNYFSFLFYSSYFIAYFQKFYKRMNKPNKHNNIIGSISSSQNGLNALFSSTSFYFKSKIIEGSHKGKNNVF